MKIAAIFLIAANKKSGRAVTELLPYDQALKEFKEAVNYGVGHSEEFPTIELWSASGTSKSHKFRRFQADVIAEKRAKEAADKAAAIEREKAAAEAAAAAAAEAAAKEAADKAAADLLEKEAADKAAADAHAKEAADKAAAELLEKEASDKAAAEKEAADKAAAEKASKKK